MNRSRWQRAIPHHTSQLVPLAVLAVAVLLPRAVHPADAFYVNLMREGDLALQRGDHAAAARDLRTACFGFLDEPDLLAEGLTLLALAQAGGDDQEGFLKTFQRLITVEERFKGYSRAATPAAVRAAFEEEVDRRVPAEMLAGADVFRGAATAAAQEAVAPSEPPTADPPTPAAGSPGATAPAAGSRESHARRTRAAPSPTAAERRQLEQLRQRLEGATRAEELRSLFDDARQLADEAPRWPAAQLLAAEVAYSSSRWTEAVTFFRRGGETQDAALQFYMAVSLYETGDRAAAAVALERALPVLDRTPFVDSYVEKILGPARGGRQEGG